MGYVLLREIGMEINKFMVVTILLSAYVVYEMILIEVSSYHYNNNRRRIVIRSCLVTRMYMDSRLGLSTRIRLGMLRIMEMEFIPSSSFHLRLGSTSLTL